MKILFYIVFVIGLLKLVSLFCVILVEVYHKLKSKFNNKDNNYLEVIKSEGWYIDNWFYIIPTIAITITRSSDATYLEFSMKWLSLDYYFTYHLKYDNDIEL